MTGPALGRATWSGSPFEILTPLAEVAGRGEVVAEQNGESEVIYESAAHPGWLVKLYLPGLETGPPEVLDRLIALPSLMRAADLEVVDRSICWPVSRVVDADRTVGVILARAPEVFTVPMRMIDGAHAARALDVDQLVQTDPEFYTRRDWSPPTMAERLAVARGLAAVGALLERHDVVYGDWSYANAFWARGSGRVFVLDMDSCGLTDRPWVESKNWDDPHAPPGSRLTVVTDRYKLAVLVLRVLTGLRGPDLRAVHAALPAKVRQDPLGMALLTAVTCGDPAERPPLPELHSLLMAIRDPRPRPVRNQAVSRPVAAPPAKPAPVPERKPSTTPSWPGPPPWAGADRLLPLLIGICVLILLVAAVAGMLASMS
ncbi:hypothetical protein FDA94_26635 [Herbidospora galbida]|uniref:Protein kinase domain-containing protein n=1 Tax=Herbidospora galbida TaxID=2575442 RepID=A0A4U3MAC4_9ACTN|nr:hypothetical protein [Herbidospora galbida]TKK85249.1 hypothetical protein FDA94_26635 [Herbidospora galbida]